MGSCCIERADGRIGSDSIDSSCRALTAGRALVYWAGCNRVGKRLPGEAIVVNSALRVAAISGGGDLIILITPDSHVGGV